MKDLIVLGSGGWIPTQRRQTCCYLYRTKETILFIDAGSGIANLERYPDILTNYDKINVVLSHYHLDHIIGLSYLLNFINEKQTLNIWGPGAAYYKRSCAEILSDVLGFPFFSRPIKKFTNIVSLMDYPPSSFFVDGIRIEAFGQVHSDPSFGLLIDDNIFYATDTIVLDETFSTSKYANILLHECWHLKPEEQSSKHSSLEEIIRMAIKHNIKNVGLIHLNPNWDIQEEQRAENMLKVLPNAFVAKDHSIINLQKMKQ